jgi:hypothetical protein
MRQKKFLHVFSSIQFLHGSFVPPKTTKTEVQKTCFFPAQVKQLSSEKIRKRKKKEKILQKVSFWASVLFFYWHDQIS